ncbi:coiled-coil domain-containing protein [Sediminibacillus halophilus]|uniref:N-terminal domain of peptidoglycan hydrolase CwlO-containing protein n=1 Tax=Sediminibacillus halophilus TaxID=482461 RepID=A0A1G9R2V0_9BACI|nr:C40 family peptidase [Sediminibacillus halophilus]SDM17187.1 N-terminal domain of peptidoglycan hydrolase CwlO-containing protein [Sediminibacillus halophilus]
MLTRKWIGINTAVMICFGSVIAAPAVSAETSLEDEHQQVQSERSEVQADIDAKQAEIEEVLAELEQLNEQIKRVEQAIKDNEQKIKDTKTEIKRTKQDIEELETEIAELEETMEKRFDILKDRAKTLQKNGGTVSYMEVILGSKNFGDFIDRVNLVSKVMDSDADLLEQHEADKEKLETKRQDMDDKLNELNDMKTELEGMQAQILEQKEQNDQLKAELKEKEEATRNEKASLEEKDQKLASEEQQIKEDIEKREKQEEQIQAMSIEQSRSDASQSSGNTSAASSSPKAAGASGNVSTVISAGYKYIGNSVYVFGGGRTASDVANGRFDCSGFVSWAFSQAGVSVPASTGALTGAGSKVSASNMKPGDLVFFDTYKKDGHVGIYIGGGNFIGSQSSTGVAVANMSSGYWKNHFKGHVVRVMN